MHQATMIIPSGAIFVLTSGPRHDLGIHGVFRAKGDIDAFALRAEWLAMHPDQSEREAFWSFTFYEWVRDRGLLEPVQCFEWYEENTFSGTVEMEVSILDAIV